MKQVLYSLVLLVLVTLTSRATTRHVPSDYETIQEAIDACVMIGSDTVLVAPGIYQEELSVINKSLTICSEYIFANDTTFRDNTILDGMDTFRPITMIGNNTHFLRLTGFSILHGNASSYDPPYGGGVRSDNTTVVLHQMVFRNNFATSGSAAYLDSCDVQMTSCLIDSNSTPFHYYTFRVTHGSGSITNTIFSANQGGGLFVTQYNGQLEHCRFLSNGRPNGGGGALLSNGVWHISHNYFYNNTAKFGGGLSVSGMDTLMLSENVFDSNYSFWDTGVANGVGGAMDLIHGTYNRIEKNLFINNCASEGGAIYANGDATIEQNIFTGNSSRRIGVLYVSTINGVHITVNFLRNLVTDNDHDPTLPGHPLLNWQGVVLVSNGSELYAAENDFIGNNAFVAGLADPGLHLQNNYWGDPSGPYHPTNNPGGSGDTINVWMPTYVEPWSTEHFWYANLEPDTSFLDFGSVTVGESETRDLIISNTGVERLILRGLSFDNPHFVSDFALDSVAIDRGNSITVQITFTPSSSEPAIATVTFDCNDPAPTPETVQLRGNGDTAIGNEPQQGMLPSHFELSHPFPNPFNSTTSFQVMLPSTTLLHLELFNVLGKRIAVLNNEVVVAGIRTFTLSADQLASGIYLLRASAPDESPRLRKVVLLR